MRSTSPTPRRTFQDSLRNAGAVEAYEAFSLRDGWFEPAGFPGAHTGWRSSSANVRSCRLCGALEATRNSDRWYRPDGDRRSLVAAGCHFRTSDDNVYLDMTSRVLVHRQRILPSHNPQFCRSGFLPSNFRTHSSAGSYNLRAHASHTTRRRSAVPNIARADLPSRAP
jgi:hypothetical protein